MEDIEEKKEDTYFSAVDDIHLHFLEYRKSELETSTMMDTFQRLTNFCFNKCNKKNIDNPNLNRNEKKCLNTCYNVVLDMRVMSLNTVFGTKSKRDN